MCPGQVRNDAPPQVSALCSYFYWKQYRTIAEVDGALKYADPDRARAQLRRDSLLRDDGFEVVHFTWQQITQTPEQVALSIRKAFRRGARNAGLRRPA